MTSSIDDRVVVVGMSLAGFRTAEALRRLGHRGQLVMIGDEPHFPPIDRPPLSKSALVRPPFADPIQLQPTIDLGNSSKLMLGRTAIGISVLDKQVIVDSGERVSYDRLVVATGSRARTLPGFCGPLEGVVRLRSINDAWHLRNLFSSAKNTVVIGSGFVGLEVAASARALGGNVTVVGSSDRILSKKVPPVVSEMLMQFHQRRGVRFELNTRVEGIEGHERVERVSLENGETLHADVVLVAVGSAPNIEWLRNSPILLGDGVLCQESLLVEGAEKIAAAGDVARWHNQAFGQSMRVEHWTNAVEQAASAAHSLLTDDPGNRRPFVSIPYFWSDQYDTKLQVLGIQTTDFSVIESDENRLVGTYSQGGAVVGGVAMNSPRALGRLRKTISDHIVEASV